MILKLLHNIQILLSQIFDIWFGFLGHVILNLEE